MMITQNTADLRKDAYLIGNTLLRLALPRLLIRVTVVLTILAVLLYCVQTILARGKSWLEFSFNVTGLAEVLGKTVVDFVMQYQKYFWWAIVVILALIALSVILLFYALGFFIETVDIRNLITGASDLLPDLE